MLKAQTKTIVIALLVFLSVVGFALRVFWLDTAPPGALIDETNFGYIAYSLAHTGKDEHGASWPLVFKGFGDQKLPAYAYMLLPFVKTFDLSVTTTRLPSALAGTGLIVLIYFFVLGVTASKKAGLVAAAIIATNPWPFILSRFALESNLALFFWVVALNGLIRIHKHPAWAVVAGVFSALTWYTYVAYRPVTLALVMIFGIAVWLNGKAHRKNVATMVVIFGVLVLPFLVSKFAATNTARLNQIGIFSDKGTIARINENRTYCANTLPAVLCSAIFNKGIAYAQILSSRYLGTYSPEYLATTGEADEKFYTVTGFGQFFVVLYPFFIWGLVSVVTRAQGMRKEVRVLIIAALLIAPLAAIFAGSAQKLRLSPLLPFLVVCITVGLMSTWNSLYAALTKKRRTILYGALAVFLVVYVGLNLQFFGEYFTVHADRNDFIFRIYVHPLMDYLHEQRLAGKTVYVHPDFPDPIMYYAFYSKMNPADYQQQAVLGPEEGNGFQHTVALDRFFVSGDDLPTVACRAVALNEPTIYVSNTEYDLAAPMYKATSTNGVLAYGYVYDALAYGNSVKNCKPE